MLNSEPLDTLIRVQTPESIDILLRPANLFQRIGAFLVDLIIRALWLIFSLLIISLLFGGLENIFDDKNFSYMAMGFILLNLFATTWLYPILFEVWNKGQTPGKKIFKIRVLTDHGSPLNWSASMIRNLLRIFDGLPFGYAIGLVSMLITDKSQRMGDLFAGTVVVTEQSNRSRTYLSYLDATEVITPPILLTQEEQYSIVSFTERQPHLLKIRQQELAQQLCDDLGLQTHDPIQTVLGMGKFYLGKDQKDVA